MNPGNNEHDLRQHYRWTRGPDWRVQLAAELFKGPSLWPDEQVDPVFRELTKYRSRTADQGRPAARKKFPRIAQAEDLERDPSRRATARLMVLAGMTSEEMSQRLKLPVPVVQIWESLYFDIRDMQGGRAWRLAHVVRREREAGQTQLAARLNLAVMAGPDGARAALECEPTGPLNEAERLSQRDLRLQLKLDEILETPLGSEAANFRIVKLYGRVWIEKQRIKLALAKLSEKCTAARERHELNMRRLELKCQAKRSAKDQPKGASRREAAAAEARRVEGELARQRREADQLARDARAAESPLAKLQWLTAPERDPPAASPRPAAERTTHRGRRKTERPGEALQEALAPDLGVVVNGNVQTVEGLVESNMTQYELVLTV